MEGMQQNTSTPRVRDLRAFIQLLQTNYADPELATAAANIDEHLHYYFNVWLPVAFEHSEPVPHVILDEGSAVTDTPVTFRECSLAAPSNSICWLWCVHRLSPVRYMRWCMSKFGSVIVPRGCGFDVEEETAWPSSSSSPSSSVSRDEPDYQLLKQMVLRQNTFLFQVSGPIFDSDEYLTQAIHRYKKFVTLIGKNRHEFTVPTYDIDLVWHTHMCNMLSYVQYCQHTTGFIINHDDSDVERQCGSKLNRGFEDTCERWEKTFEEKYTDVEGALFKGSPDTTFNDNMGHGKEYHGTAGVDENSTKHSTKHSTTLFALATLASAFCFCLLVYALASGSSPAFVYDVQYDAKMDVEHFGFSGEVREGSIESRALATSTLEVNSMEARVTAAHPSTHSIALNFSTVGLSTLSYIYKSTMLALECRLPSKLCKSRTPRDTT